MVTIHVVVVVGCLVLCIEASKHNAPYDDDRSQELRKCDESRVRLLFPKIAHQQWLSVGKKYSVPTLLVGNFHIHAIVRIVSI